MHQLRQVATNDSLIKYMPGSIWGVYYLIICDELQNILLVSKARTNSFDSVPRSGIHAIVQNVQLDIDRFTRWHQCD